MTNPIPPVRVDIVEGDNTAVPGLQRTGDAIAHVAAGASTGLSPIQKLSKAMVLAEGREGSQVLRAVRGEIASLGEQALGTQGPLGRLGIVLAEFGIGGATGLAVLGGLAAATFAWREFTKETREAEKATDDAIAALLKLHEARRGPEATQGEQVNQARDRLAEIDESIRRQRALVAEQRRQFTGTGLGDTAPEVAGPLADLNALIQKRGSVLQAINAPTQAEQAQHNKLAEALEREVDVRTRAIATDQDENAMLIALADANARAQAAVEGLDVAHTASLVAQARRIERLKEENKALEDQRNVLEEIGRISADVNRFLASPQGLATIQGIRTPTLNDFLGITKHGQNVDEDIFGAFAGGRKRSALDLADPFGKQAGDAMGKAFIEKSLNKPSVDAGRVINDSVAIIGAIQGGSAGAALSSIGGLLGGIKGVPTPISLGISAVGSLLDGFAAERRHRELLAALKRIEQRAQLGPTQIRPVFVDSRGDAAATAYAVGRLQDRDAIPRGVGGP